MKERSLQDIVSDLTGPIYPASDSAINAERRNNLKEYLELFQVMAMNVFNIAKEKDSPYHSSKIMGEDAYKIMKEITDFFNDKMK